MQHTGADGPRAVPASQTSKDYDSGAETERTMKLPGLVRMKHFEDGTAATLLEPTEAYGTDHQHGDAGLGT